MQHFVRQSVKGGKVGAFKKYYEIGNSNIIFNIIKKYLNINGNISIFDIVEIHF